jgi:hypothetical protein
MITFNTPSELKSEHANQRSMDDNLDGLMPRKLTRLTHDVFFRMLRAI